MDEIECPVVAPVDEVAVDGPPMREVLGHHAPGAPGAGQVQMALMISRLEWSRGRPPGATGAVLGNKGSSIAHWRSVRSVGYLRPCATHTSAAQPRGNREHRGDETRWSRAILRTFPRRSAVDDSELRLQLLPCRHLVSKHVLRLQRLDLSVHYRLPAAAVQQRRCSASHHVSAVDQRRKRMRHLTPGALESRSSAVRSSRSTASPSATYAAS